jgi:hypothetical protein
MQEWGVRGWGVEARIMQGLTEGGEVSRRQGGKERLAQTMQEHIDPLPNMRARTLTHCQI